VRELERLTLERGTPQVIVSDNELSKKAMAPNEHTSAVARRASNWGYDCAIVEKTMRRRGSLRVGAPSIGIGGSLATPPLPHHRTYGAVYGGSAG
jgi:hypothetical protein